MNPANNRPSVLQDENARPTRWKVYPLFTSLPQRPPELVEIAILLHIISADVFLEIPPGCREFRVEYRVWAGMELQEASAHCVWRRASHAAEMGE